MRDIIEIKIRSYVEKDPKYYSDLFPQQTKRERRDNPLGILDNISSMTDLALSDLFERVIILKNRQR